MEDTRVLWMRERVYAALGLPAADGKFRELLEREGGRAGKELKGLLDESAGQYSPAIIFYPLEQELEEEVEVVEGERVFKWGRGLWFHKETANHFVCVACTYTKACTQLPTLLSCVSTEQLIERLVEEAERLEDQSAADTADAGLSDLEDCCCCYCYDPLSPLQALMLAVKPVGLGS